MMSRTIFESCISYNFVLNFFNVCHIYWSFVLLLGVLFTNIIFSMTMIYLSIYLTNST